MKTLYVCFSIIMLLLFSGCASDDELKSLKEENQRLKEENEQMKRVYFGEEITKENHSSSADIEGIPIALGKPFSSQNKAEITIQKVFFTDDVVPEKKSNFYTHYPAGDGKIYIAAVTTIKNLTSKEIEADKLVDATVIYDGFYNFECMEILFIKDDFYNSSIFMHIDQLNPEIMYFIVELPAEAKDNSKSIDLQFKIGNEQFIYHYR